MTITKCPECHESDKVVPHCNKRCGLLKCTRCDTLWTIDGKHVFNPNYIQGGHAS